jgi:hypothetical protein
MNATQAMIILKNGSRKYGFILNNGDSGRIQFISGAENMSEENMNSSSLIEHIPVEHIASIDTYLK